MITALVGLALALEVPAAAAAVSVEKSLAAPRRIGSDVAEIVEMKSSKNYAVKC